MSDLAENPKETFFRQGGWMVAAALIGGVFMFAVHPAYFPFLGEEAYGDFQAILSLLNVMVIPGIGLQTVFAHQSAAAISPEENESLVVSTQTLLRWTFCLWLAIAVLMFAFSGQILDRLKLPGTVALGITLVLGLGQLWTPILSGLLQGRHNFLWLGWATIVNGVGRFLTVGLIVIVLGGRATGAALGALIGVYLAVAILGIHSRDIWLSPKPKKKFASRKWLAQVIPLTLGLGASQFIFSVDYLIVRDIFGENQTGSYAAAGMLGRGIVLFTAPLTAVMFAKIVRNLSHGKKSRVLLYTLLATLVMGVLAAAVLTAIGIFLQHAADSGPGSIHFLPAAIAAKISAKPEVARLIGQLAPWFAWCMLPLALANVLLNNLMARKKFRVVPYLLIVLAAYVTTLAAAGTSFVRVIQILGIYNVVFLLVVAGFTWLPAKKRNLEEISV